MLAVKIALKAVNEKFGFNYTLEEFNRNKPHPKEVMEFLRFAFYEYKTYKREITGKDEIYSYEYRKVSERRRY